MDQRIAVHSQQLLLMLVLTLISTSISAQTWYVRGEDNSWNTDDGMTAVDIPESGEDLYVATIDAIATDATDEFKIASSDWGSQRTTQGTVTKDGGIVTYGTSGGNSNFSSTSGYYYTFIFEDAADKGRIYEFSDKAPVSITATTSGVTDGQVDGEAVTITCTLSASKASNQKIVLRYSTSSIFDSDVDHVQMTQVGGTNTYTGDIPASFLDEGETIYYYTYSIGNISLPGQSEVRYSTINFHQPADNSFTVSGYTTTGGGDGSWNDPDHWGGSVPGSGSSVTISHDTQIDQDVTVSGITIDASKTVTNDGVGRRISIQDGGVLTNNGTWTANGEIIDFEGDGTIDGTTAVTMNDLELNGELTVTTSPTINGTLTLNSNGTMTASPSYGPSSTLNYNSGGTYGRYFEWDDNNQSDPGYPYNVTLSNSTHLDLRNGTDATRYVGGTLTIESGSYLDCESNTGDLVVSGDISNAGTLNMSSAGGGDLDIYGDWTNTGTFNNNGRSINFKGTQDPQTITETSGDDWSYFHINKSSGNVKLMTDLNINNTWSDNLVFDDAGGLDLNDNRLTLALGANIDQNYVGTVNITNSGSGEGVFDLSGQSTFTGTDGSKEFNFGDNVTLEINGMITGLNQVTITDTLEVKSGGSFSGSGPVWGANSTWYFNTGGTENYSNWSATAWNNTVYNICIANGSRFDLNSDGTITSSGTVTVKGDLVIWDGSANRDMDLTNLTIGADGLVNMNNTIGADCFISGDLHVVSGGTFQTDDRMVEFDGSGDQTISGDFGAQKLDYVNINNSHATEGVQLQTDLTIDQEMRWIDGFVFLNNSDLIYDANCVHDGGNWPSATSHAVTNGSGVFTKEDMSTSTTFVFPIGQAAGTYNYFMMETAGAGHTTDDISARVESGTCDASNGWDADAELTNSDDFVNCTWVLTEGVAGGTAGDLNFYWYGSQEGSSFTRASSKIYHYTGGVWSDESFNLRDNGGEPYRVRTAAPGTFSPFTVGDDMPAVLPVDMGPFTGSFEDDLVVLSWTTLSEVNNDHFIIERSIDGNSFETIGQLAGAGLVSEATDYEFVDHQAPSGASTLFYRLTQVDYNGDTETFNPIVVTKGKQSGFGLKAAPNPVASGEVAHVSFGEKAEGAQLQIVDMVGKVVWKDADMELVNNQYALPHLSAGSYLITVAKDGRFEQTRLQVTR